jgi:RNA polymerase sigma-70 factor (ECF subfamily)
MTREYLTDARRGTPVISALACVPTSCPATLPGDHVVGAVTFGITGGKIATVRGIAAPTRLVPFTEAWRKHEPDTPLITQW